MFVAVIVGFAIAYYFYNELYGKRRGLPPGPTPWPIVGNLLQLDQKRPEKTLFEWGKNYGSVFTVWMPQPMIMVNDYETMKETFLKQGDTFAGRPETFLVNTLLKGNFGLAFSTGKMWRENRRFSLHALRDFGIGRNTLQPQIMDQATQLIANLHNTTGPVTLRDPFTVTKCTFNNILLNNIQ
jgi:cytochrome P450